MPGSRSDFGLRFMPSVEGGLLELWLSFSSFVSSASSRVTNSMMRASFCSGVRSLRLGIFVMRSTMKHFAEVGPCGWRITQPQILFNEGELPSALN